MKTISTILKRIFDVPVVGNWLCVIFYLMVALVACWVTKTVAIEIGVDNAVLSKAQTGQARLSETAMNDLMDACGSEAWLHY